MNAPTTDAAKAKVKKPKQPPTIKIIPRLCKGCGICVAFCPAQVLLMKEGKAVVAHLEKCTTCMFCELRCPDFAISVEPAAETGGN